MNDQQYFDTFNDSDSEQLDMALLAAQFPPVVERLKTRNTDLRRQLAAVAAERDALKSDLDTAMDDANYWHSRYLEAGE